jgi:hypothetical protein
VLKGRLRRQPLGCGIMQAGTRDRLAAAFVGSGRFGSRPADERRNREFLGSWSRYACSAQSNENQPQRRLFGGPPPIIPKPNEYRLSGCVRY